jgi:hypothetical protein
VQAGGRESLADLKAELVLRDACLAKYERNFSALRDELIYLHSNLRLLSQLKAFPSELFEAPPALMWFLDHNLTTECVLICFRTWLDRRSTSLTLRRLAKWLVETAVRPEYKSWLEEQLAGGLPPSAVQDQAEALRDLRHATLAHLDSHVIAGLKSPPKLVAFDDLRSVADALGRYLNAMSFGGTHLFVIGQFYSSGDLWHEGDLGYVLDQIALGSKWFEAPTRFPDFFKKHMRPGLSEQELEAINSVRRRHNMEVLQ